MNFPKYKYHATEQPLVVQTREHELELGEEWADSPADHGVVTHPSVEQMAAIEAGLVEEEPEEVTEVPGSEPGDEGMASVETATAAAEVGKPKKAAAKAPKKAAKKAAK